MNKLSLFRPQVIRKLKLYSVGPWSDQNDHGHLKKRPVGLVAFLLRPWSDKKTGRTMVFMHTSIKRLIQWIASYSYISFCI